MGVISSVALLIICLMSLLALRHATESQPHATALISEAKTPVEDARAALLAIFGTLSVSIISVISLLSKPDQKVKSKSRLSNTPR